MKKQSNSNIAEDQKNPSDHLQPTARIDFLIKIINRYDSYITSTNTKASLIIAWNGVVIGTILLRYKDIIGQFSCMSKMSNLAGVLLAICGIMALVSNGLIFSVVFPFLTASRDGRGSLIYFGSVAKTDPQEYSNAIQAATSGDLIEDLTHQASTLAVGLEKKMRRLQKSIWAIYAELVSIALLAILFASNN